ncbi:MAG: ubiquitin-like domain-containing protein [Candidatus Jordarchaeales archaeon]
MMRVKIVSAIGGDAWDMDVRPDMKIKKVKEEVAKRKKVPEDAISIAFRGFQVNDDRTIEELGVEEGDKLYVIVRETGG